MAKGNNKKKNIMNQGGCGIRNCILSLFDESEWTTNVWSYCTTADAMAFSIASKTASAIPVREDAAFMLIEGHKYAHKVDVRKLDLGNSTLGTIRFTLYRLIIFVRQPSVGNDRTGREVIEDAYFPQCEELSLCEKHLESDPCDPYDDFNPRHPPFKSHRRGGSFFNSDISDTASQVAAADLSIIAKMALDLERCDE